jgi:CubicO group peptidase (beta-lactamase class C family)
MFRRLFQARSPNGHWSPAFAAVAEEFGRQLATAPSTGAALCIYHEGERVVDIWGGTRGPAGEPWLEDTLVMAFSTGKGVAATLFHSLVDEGLADYDDRVARHWPEFASEGKQDITIRQLLSHGAGLYRLGEMVDDFWHVLDFEAMARRVAAARPAHRPGDGTGYHGITYSWALGELLRRVGKRPVPQLLKERLVDRLGLDGAYFGLPEHEFARCAELVGAQEPLTFFHHALGAVAPLVRTASVGRVRLDELRASLVLPAAGGLSWNDPRLRRACLLSSTGVFTARSLAHLYGSLGDGRLLSPRTLAAASSVQSVTADRVTGIRSDWRLGYHGIQLRGRFVPHAFGHCGYRGTGAFVEPTRKLGFAFVHNTKSGLGPMGGARFERLAERALKCADRRA